MTGRSPSPPIRTKWALPLRLARIVGCAVLVLFGLATLGALFPRLLVLGELGPVLIGPFGPWITILSLLGTVVVFAMWRSNHRKSALVLALISAFAGVGTLWIQASQIGVSNGHGARISIAEALLARSQADDALQPQSATYTVHDGQALPIDIYSPASTARSGAAPVFVYVHGGGWGGETLKQRQADFRWFAERGYVVMSVEYSLSSETRHTWNVATPQLGCALAWIAGNATRFGGDPERIALWGESAGGNLVLNASYMSNGGTLQPSCPGKLPRVDAAIALYPVVDPARMYRNDRPLIGVFGRMMTVNYTGGTPEQFPDRYSAIASRTHIGPNAPPTLLIVPEADHLVVPQAAYDFAAAARAGGIATSLIRMPYAEHSFDLRSGSIGNQFVRQAMLRFLEKQGLRPDDQSR